MIYYQVLPEHDQKRKPGKRHDILIADELYTEKEFKKLGIVSSVFKKVEIPKNQTYFFFGARKSSVK